MTEGGAKLFSSGTKTKYQVEEISTDSDPLDILIHANQQLSNFLLSLKTSSNVSDFSEFNLKITDAKTINKKLETQGDINILNKTYAQSLKNYLQNESNILTQYKDLLIKLIPE